jgi:hypothetical protein
MVQTYARSIFEAIKNKPPCQIPDFSGRLCSMRKILWMLLLFGAYMWSMTSGHDRMIIDQGKNVYNALVAWFDDAEIDFQVKQKKPTKVKKKSRRWD